MMLTRRVRGRVFLLKPGNKTDQIIRYVVAVLANDLGIELHAIVAMSNHWHLCMTDPRANIIDFQRDCHSFISRALNAQYGEFEAVWASEPTSRVECVEPEDLISKIAYTMANPVEAGLVRYGKSWPGVRHAWPCRPMEIQRPTKFFRGIEVGGRWPKTAALRFTRPPGYEKLADDEMAALVDDAVDQRECDLRAKADAAGRRFLGRKAVRAQPRHSRPGTREPRFQLSPSIACRNKWRRIETLLANKRWRTAYASALVKWKAGIRDVVFPFGTYEMRKRHEVTCAAAPT